jgi:hypothetical protein
MLTTPVQTPVHEASGVPAALHGVNVTSPVVALVMVKTPWPDFTTWPAAVTVHDGAVSLRAHSRTEVASMGYVDEVDTEPDASLVVTTNATAWPSCPTAESAWAMGATSGAIVGISCADTIDELVAEKFGAEFATENGLVIWYVGGTVAVPEKPVTGVKVMVPLPFTTYVPSTVVSDVCVHPGGSSPELHNLTLLGVKPF